MNVKIDETGEIIGKRYYRGPNKIKTPRGEFYFRFDSLEAAKEYNYTTWFVHDGVSIVCDGRQAFAVYAAIDDVKIMVRTGLGFDVAVSVSNIFHVFGMYDIDVIDAEYVTEELGDIIFMRGNERVCVIGQGCTICAGVKLDDAQICNNSLIGFDTTVKNSFVGDRCYLSGSFFGCTIGSRADIDGDIYDQFIGAGMVLHAWL